MQLQIEKEALKKEKDDISKNRLLEIDKQLSTLKEQEQKDTIDELKGEQKDIAWGSQIRSYVFCPYTLVKDHRTNFEVGNVESVMDGNIDGFIESYLKGLI